MMKSPRPEALLREADWIIAHALADDLGKGDLTTLALIPDQTIARGNLRAGSGFILAGWPVAKRVFSMLDPKVRIERSGPEGRKIKAGESIARVQGRARALLMAERTALNFLQQLSGIATLTSRFVAAVKGSHAQIAATRKTHPGLQRLEKYAVMIGGGLPHRLGLDDGILIKDNHLALTGSVTQALRLARAFAGKRKKLEVEVETLDQVSEALAGGADIIMLDNMSRADMRKAVKLVRGQALVEASGGVTLGNAAAVARTGVDLISVGALTHSAPAMDISFELEPLPKR